MKRHQKYIEQRTALASRIIERSEDPTYVPIAPVVPPLLSVTAKDLEAPIPLSRIELKRIGGKVKPFRMEKPLRSALQQAQEVLRPVAPLPTAPKYPQKNKKNKKKKAKKNKDK